MALGIKIIVRLMLLTQYSVGILCRLPDTIEIGMTYWRVIVCQK